MVLCTTTGSGGSRMSRRLDPDEPAVEAVGPPVGSVIGPPGGGPARGGRGWRRGVGAEEDDWRGRGRRARDGARRRRGTGGLGGWERGCGSLEAEPRRRLHLGADPRGGAPGAWIRRDSRERVGDGRTDG